MKKIQNIALGVTSLLSTSLMADVLEVPASVVTDLTGTAVKFGGSALIVWGGVALAAIGIVVFKKIFR